MSLEDRSKANLLFFFKKNTFYINQCFYVKTCSIRGKKKTSFNSTFAMRKLVFKGIHMSTPIFIDEKTETQVTLNTLVTPMFRLGVSI